MNLTDRCVESNIACTKTSEKDFIVMELCKYDCDRNNRTLKSVVLQIPTMGDNDYKFGQFLAKKRLFTGPNRPPRPHSKLRRCASALGLPMSWRSSLPLRLLVLPFPSLHPHRTLKTYPEPRHSSPPVTVDSPLTRVTIKSRRQCVHCSPSSDAPPIANVSAQSGHAGSLQRYGVLPPTRAAGRLPSRALAEPESASLQAPYPHYTYTNKIY
jgi:hypothetical protein